jgi:inosine-uridine nucleoside N-ribohydrolase
MDGGIDDALALILAMKSEELEVSGITAVSGNVSADQATINALRVVELVGRENVWVARGLAKPLVREPIRATSFHGKDGLGNSHLPSPQLKPRKNGALDQLSVELASARRRELTIIATGPLTNIAALFTKEQDAPRRIKEISIMGGAYGLTEYGIGNETATAEFNIYSDPEAAKVVFESEVPLKAVGLDVTMIPAAQFSLSDYSRVNSSGSRAAGFASRILARAMRKKRFALHDPMAVAAVSKPSMFTFEDLPVVVETHGEYTTGMTVVDRRLVRGDNAKTVSVCSGVKTDSFRRIVVSALTS